MKVCILIHATVPKRKYAAEVWDGRAKLVRELDTEPMTAATKIFGSSRETSDTVLRAEPQMYPLETKKEGMRKSKWQRNARNVPMKRLLSRVCRAAWNRGVTEGGAEIR